MFCESSIMCHWLLICTHEGPVLWKPYHFSHFRCDLHFFTTSRASTACQTARRGRPRRLCGAGGTLGAGAGSCCRLAAVRLLSAVPQDSAGLSEPWLAAGFRHLKSFFGIGAPPHRFAAGRPCEANVVQHRLDHMTWMARAAPRRCERPHLQFVIE
jgi:hypothetical protein